MRTIEYNHGEAFCLMWYACQCGHRERIWNSRDGVTPFAASCPSCKDTMRHVDWSLDVRETDHKPLIGQKIWRDGTPDEAEAIMRRRLEKVKGTQWAPTPEIADKLIKSARDAAPESEFHKGWPMLATTTEETTP